MWVWSGRFVIDSSSAGTPSLFQIFDGGLIHPATRIFDGEIRRMGFVAVTALL
jgi:hypothetical protein